MLTKEECLKTLEIAKCIDHQFYHCYTLEDLYENTGHKNLIECFEQLINEHFDNTPNFKHFKLHADSTLNTFKKSELIDYIHMIYNNWQRTDYTCENVIKMNYKLQSEIDELKSNPPLKFEELKEGQWVWDNKYKEYIPINNVNVEKRIFNEWEYIDTWGESDYDCEKFEENRFYERQVKE